MNNNKENNQNFKELEEKIIKIAYTNNIKKLEEILIENSELNVIELEDKKKFTSYYYY